MNLATAGVMDAKTSGVFQQDVTSFRIDGRFDVIICVFDSINHVRRFSDWKKAGEEVKALREIFAACIFKPEWLLRDPSKVPQIILCDHAGPSSLAA